MAADSEQGDAFLSPDDAFAVLGNETRMEILRTLARTESPQSFSELREQVGVSDSGQFNYHLDKLDGHFISKSDEQYSLQPPGQRVIEAVFSGAVTETPVVDRAEIDVACPYCEAAVEMRFFEERVEIYCTQCAGTFEYSDMETGSAGTGFLGQTPLPPAGIQGRSPHEIVEAAATWGNLELLAGSSDICPRCSARVENSVNVCQNHDSTEGLCNQCHRHHRIGIEQVCTNCIYSISGVFSLYLRTNPDMMSFQMDHGLNPASPAQLPKFMQLLLDYDETITSTDPLEARFTFTLDGDALTLTVDADLNVVEAMRRSSSESVR
ncbi:MAG: ArsR/SmtB family transcription factor [Halobacteriales archaeon]